jgi:hypothetical protein
VVAGLLTLKHRRRFTVSHYAHGFRRTTAEIEAAARTHSLAMRDYWEGAFTTDFQRSIVLQRVLARANGREGGLHSFGKLMPYVRMATFVKN